MNMMDLEPRSLHISRAQRVLTHMGIELAGTVTTQFVAQLLAAVDADRTAQEPRVLLDRLLEGRPDWAAEVAADEPLIGHPNYGNPSDALEAIHRFADRLVAFHRERRYSLEPPPLHPENRKRLIAMAEDEARSPDPELRVLAAQRLTVVGGHDDLLQRLAGDPDARVARAARRELDRRGPSP